MITSKFMCEIIQVCKEKVACYNNNNNIQCGQICTPSNFKRYKEWSRWFLADKRTSSTWMYREMLCTMKYEVTTDMSPFCLIGSRGFSRFLLTNRAVLHCSFTVFSLLSKMVSWKDPTADPNVPMVDFFR